LIERVRVVGLVLFEPGWELVEKTSGKNLFHKLALGRAKRFEQIRRVEDCYQQR
jgi:hypothetical protein